MRVVHPLADEWTDDYAVFVAHTQHLALTDPLDSFVQWAVSEGLRPVVLSTRAATVSPLLSLAMQRSGGVWAVRDGDAVYDALTGFRVGAFHELWTDLSMNRPRLDSFGHVRDDAQAVLGFDVFAHQRADADARIGAMATTMSRGLGGSAPDVMGQVEPLSEPFNVDALTELARRQMPKTDVLHAGAGDGGYADIEVSRTRRGILEHVVGGVPIGAYPRTLAEVMQAATTALTDLQERHQPTVGFVSLVEVDGVNGQEARMKRPEVPLAVLLGPRAVHDLRASVDQLRAAHDVVEVGRRRLPSLLVRFSRPDLGSWAQLTALAHSLGMENVNRAAGLVGG